MWNCFSKSTQISKQGSYDIKTHCNSTIVGCRSHSHRCYGGKHQPTLVVHGNVDRQVRQYDRYTHNFGKQPITTQESVDEIRDKQAMLEAMPATSALTATQAAPLTWVVLRLANHWLSLLETPDGVTPGTGFIAALNSPQEGVNVPGHGQVQSASGHGYICPRGIDRATTKTVVSSRQRMTFLGCLVTTPGSGSISLTLTLTCVKFLLIGGCLPQPCIWMAMRHRGGRHQTATAILALGGIQFCYRIGI